MPRTFLAARYADAQKADAGSVELGKAPYSVVIVRVTRVDDHVAVLEQWLEFGDHLIDRRPGLNHDDDRARALEHGDEGRQLPAAHHVGFELAGPFEKRIDLFRRAVVNGDLVAIVGDIEGQVFAHHPQPDQTDVSLLHTLRLSTLFL